ncbi:hypothetical protein KCP73_05995 [Salmonella enterica subsp. enterica]|nr:hypothetical protein KCP73_05995 [Salmonella enterica subsp. enterica]
MRIRRAEQLLCQPTIHGRWRTAMNEHYMWRTGTCAISKSRQRVCREDTMHVLLYTGRNMGVSLHRNAIMTLSYNLSAGVGHPVSARMCRLPIVGHIRGTVIAAIVWSCVIEDGPAGGRRDQLPGPRFNQR